MGRGPTLRIASPDSHVDFSRLSGSPRSCTPGRPWRWKLGPGVQLLGQRRVGSATHQLEVSCSPLARVGATPNSVWGCVQCAAAWADGGSERIPTARGSFLLLC